MAMFSNQILKEGVFLNKWFNSRIESNKNVLLAITGGTGCLSGDTQIRISRMKGTKIITLKKLYNYFYNPKENKNRKVFDTSVPIYLRSFNDKEIRLHKFKDVIYSGKKKVYKLILEDGKSIKATEEHKFLTPNDWIELRHLKMGDIVLCDTPKPEKNGRKRIKLRDISLKVDYHPYRNPHNNQVEVHRLIYEARMNNLTFLEFIDILLNESNQSKELKFIDTSLYVIHHKDGFHYNNSIENLQLVTIEEHKKLHSDNQYINFSQGIPKPIKIKEIIEGDIEDTYDIECDEPYHNFVANDIIVHNSGKTYSCLDAGENWYRYKFNEDYPIENVCFGLAILAKRINELHKAGTLRKGELFVLEEAGANFGNLDFQNKLSKMFQYILQSFRSMNLIVIMNLPVLTMLNKGARQLIHAHFITAGIDYNNKQTKVKPYFHQLNQNTGKSYWKYPRVSVNNKTISLQRLKFNRPTDRLISLYEFNKAKFVFSLTEDFVKEAESNDKSLQIKMERKNLTDIQAGILDSLSNGMTKEQIVNDRGLHINTINFHIRAIKKKGYDVDKYINIGKSL